MPWSGVSGGGYLGDRFVAADGFNFDCFYFPLVDLLADPDPGRIRGHRPAVVEVVQDHILRLHLLLFHHDPDRDRRRVLDFDQGLYRLVDPARVPVALSRLPVGLTKHPVPPSRRVHRVVVVRDRHKDRRDPPAGYPHQLAHGIHAHPVTACRVVVVQRPSTHHLQLGNSAIRPDQQALVMVTVGPWPFVSVICP